MLAMNAFLFLWENHGPLGAKKNNMSDENNNTPTVSTGDEKKATEATEAPKATEATSLDAARDPEAGEAMPAFAEEAAAGEEATKTAEVAETAPNEKTAAEPEEIKTEEAVEEKLPGTEIRVTTIKPGMTIRVHERIKDLNAKGEERERIQVFQGMVVGLRGAGLSKTMTLRREHKGFGVEKIYPLASPVVTKVELVKTAKVRRAKLSYLQNLRQRFKRKLKEERAEVK